MKLHYGRIKINPASFRKISNAVILLGISLIGIPIKLPNLKGTLTISLLNKRYN